MYIYVHKMHYPSKAAHANEQKLQKVYTKSATYAMWSESNFQNGEEDEEDGAEEGGAEEGGGEEGEHELEGTYNTNPTTTRTTLATSINPTTPGR